MLFVVRNDENLTMTNALRGVYSPTPAPKRNEAFTCVPDNRGLMPPVFT